MGGTSLAVQWLGLGSFTPVGLDLIPGQGTKILQAAWCSQKEMNKREMKWAQKVCMAS